MRFARTCLLRVFAPLMLALAPRDVVIAAMAGHVLAAGEFVGEYQQTVAPLE